MAYLLIIIFGMALIGIYGTLFCDVFSYSVLYSALCPILLTIVVIAIDGLLAFIIRRLPNRYFTCGKPIFSAKKRERKLYEALGIKRWKDSVLELGGFTDFHKDHVREPDNPEYLKRFVMECNYGSLIHIFDAVFGYLIIFITPLDRWYVFAFPVAFVNMVLNLMPMMILRYNVPRLETLIRFAERKKKAPVLDTASEH